MFLYNVGISFVSAKRRAFKRNFVQEVKVSTLPVHLIQIRASEDEIMDRIDKFIQRKREEINRSNIRDFCSRDPELEIEFSCARIDSVLLKRKDSVGHLKGTITIRFALQIYCVITALYL